MNQQGISLCGTTIESSDEHENALQSVRIVIESNSNGIDESHLRSDKHNSGIRTCPNEVGKSLISQLSRIGAKWGRSHQRRHILPLCPVDI
jgi:hypothetical protein